MAFPFPFAFPLTLSFAFFCPSGRTSFNVSPSSVSWLEDEVYAPDSSTFVLLFFYEQSLLSLFLYHLGSFLRIFQIYSSVKGFFLFSLLNIARALSISMSSDSPLANVIQPYTPLNLVTATLILLQWLLSCPFDLLLAPSGRPALNSSATLFQ